jgi:hypothetical protein
MKTIMPDGETLGRGCCIAEWHCPRSRLTAAAPSQTRYFPYPSSARLDSLGVLWRNDGWPHNNMKELTLAAMSHVPTAVMFVMDLSGGAEDKCSSVEDQLVLRTIPLQAPWIDVVSKVNLAIVDGVRERLVQILEEDGRVQEQRAERSGDGRGAASADMHFIELSIKEGLDMEELRQEVMRVLGKVRVVLDTMSALDKRSARTV